MFAQGGADFMVTGNLNPWDHAAGALIAREAGGYLKMLDGTPYRPTMTTGNLLVAKDRDSWNALAEPLKAAIFGV
ncbi:MAG: inositol monophosphatase family protein [Pseudomonadota bacterium]|nr:inositol monophosphatase family protein [Pseudomonadota bacterium]